MGVTIFDHAYIYGGYGGSDRGGGGRRGFTLAREYWFPILRAARDHDGLMATVI